MFCALLLTKQGFADSSGPISTVDSLISLHKEEYKKLEVDYRNFYLSKSQIENIKDYQLNKTFLKSIFLHSNPQVLKLANKDRCTWFAVLESSLMRDTKGSISTVYLESKDKKIALPLVDYLDLVYRTECPENKEYRSLFGDINFMKTLNGLGLKIPENKKNCEEVFQKWQGHALTPNLLKYGKILSEGKMARLLLVSIDKKNLAQIKMIEANISYYDYLIKMLNSSQKILLENLYTYLGNGQKFCNQLMTKNTWSMSAEGLAPKSYLRYRCKDNDLLACAQNLKLSPAQCVEQNARKYSSLFPKQNCNQIDSSLYKSHLNVDYIDCPGQSQNLSLINIHRIIQHFIPTPYQSNSVNCATEAYYSYAKLLITFKNDKAWPLKLCFQDPFSSEKKCQKYIPGDRVEEKLSEVNIVSQFLKRMKSVGKDVQCKLVSDLDYNPLLLQFQAGCFIVIKSKTCSDGECQRDIIYAQRKIEGISYEGHSKIIYFPEDYVQETFSLNHILDEVYKIKFKPIKNLTEVNGFLKTNSQNLIHGVGCIEDLLPEYFSQRALNKCTPTPFIIDNLSSEAESVMPIRLAVDDVQSPRAIEWNFIFNSIIKYQQLHPMGLWTLYGLSR